MKRILLLSLLSAAALNSFAQRANVVTRHISSTNAPSFISSNSVAHRSTGDGDTVAYFNIPSNDTPIVYTYTGTDGAIYGMNTAGTKAYAERYDINGADSSVTVIGAVAFFTGAHSSTSTHTIDIKAWSMGDTVYAGVPNYFFSGFPNTVLATQQFNVTDLTFDNIKSYMFGTPAANIGGSFFIGYDINYDPATMNGDTVNLVASQDGNRMSSPLIAVGTDTLLNDVTVAQLSNNTWVDNFWQYTADPANNVAGYANDYYIAPIMVIKYTGVSSVTRKNLTFFGNYPNPAVNNTNIKFALKNSANVTVTITDMSGRTINTIQSNNVSTGEHTIAVQTSDMPAGNYIYTIRTSDGSMMASQLTVIK